MKRNYPQFFAITKKFDIEKDVIALTYSGNRTESLRDMTDTEFSTMMTYLISLNNPSAAPKRVPGDKQRKTLMSMGYQMEWGKTADQVIEAIDEWCLKQKFKKKLMDHTPAELNVLVHIMRSKVLASFLAGLN